MRNIYSKTTYKSKASINLLCLAFMLIISVLDSYGQVVFNPRTSNATPTQEVYSVKGDFAMIGNANLKLVNYSDTADNDDDMEYVDVDAIAETINSSSANLLFSTENGAVPECSNILYAGLYWVGRADAGADTNADGDNNPNTFNVTHNGSPKSLNKTQVRLKGPGDTTYQLISASTNPNPEINYPTNGNNRNIYVGYSEVTDFVKARGLGEYTVADIALREGNIDVTGFSGGWGMVVVYENSKMKWRDITVFDGYAYVGAGGLPQTISASGFDAVQNGDVNLKLGLMASEGEVGWAGDFFSIEQQNSGIFQPLSHSRNTTTNFFNSSILVDNDGDSFDDPRDESRQNNAGLDVVVFNVDNSGNSLIDNGQTSTRFRYGTVNDSYAIFNVTFAVDAYIPEPEVVITNTSINGNPPSGTNSSLQPSQSAIFTIDIRNTGTEDITNGIITIPLTEAIDPTNLNLSSNVYPPLNSTTNPNTPFYDSSVGPFGSIIWEIGDLPLPTDPDTVLADLSFSLTVTTDCSVLGDSNFEPNVSVTGNISGEGAISGVAFITDLILGYQENGTCVGEPITGELQIPIDYEDYVNSPPTASNPEPINLECTDTIPDPDTNVVTDEADNSGIPPIVTWLSDVSDSGTCTEVIIRTYRVTDDCGKFTDVEQTITITTPPFTITDINGGSTVECIADATETFTLPTVTDACGNTLSPSAAVVTEDPDPLTCEGTRTYAYTYEDCAGNTDTWAFIYTINTPAFTIADEDGGSTVECIADATETFTLPTVTDACGNTLLPSAAVVTEDPDPLTCEGTRTYTYTYEDCAGNTDTWEYTYTIDTPAFTIAEADGGSTVECIADATETFTLPTVTDACGNTLSPSAAVVTETPDPLTCEGTRTYAYTYEDCAGNTDTWAFIYTINTPAFTIADEDGGSTVECIADATETFTLPTVTDACGNTLSPSAAVVTETPDPLTCEGTRTYTYTYTDCANNSDTWAFTYTIETPAFT
ncbi:hypothetical protein HC176_08050, partial [Tamlana crocina]|nr:hypothetical protein [Tamlana crocina]